MSLVLHPTCPKISNFRNVGRVKSYIQAVRYQSVPYSGRLIYFFYFYENSPACHTCFWYLQITSRVFPSLNFEYCITCQLCRFRCKSAPVYVLLHFSNVFADWYFFLLTLLEFYMSFSLALEKKTPGKKASKKCFAKLSQKYPSIIKSFKGKWDFSNTYTSFGKIKWFV